MIILGRSSEGFSRWVIPEKLSLSVTEEPRELEGSIEGWLTSSVRTFPFLLYRKRLFYLCLFGLKLVFLEELLEYCELLTLRLQRMFCAANARPVPFSSLILILFALGLTYRRVFFLVSI